MESREADELFAMKCLSKGSGMQDVNHPKYDQAYVAWWLEDRTRVNVYLLKGGETKAIFQFEVREVPDDRKERYDDLSIKKTDTGWAISLDEGADFF